MLRPYGLTCTYPSQPALWGARATTKATSTTAPWHRRPGRGARVLADGHASSPPGRRQGGFFTAGRELLNEALEQMGRCSEQRRGRGSDRRAVVARRCRVHDVEVVVGRGGGMASAGVVVPRHYGQGHGTGAVMLRHRGQGHGARAVMPQRRRRGYATAVGQRDATTAPSRGDVRARLVMHTLPSCQCVHIGRVGGETTGSREWRGGGAILVRARQWLRW